MEDTFRHKGMRKRLVDELEEKGITDKVVLAALRSVPRHLFFDKAFLEYAYKDNAFPIGAGQTISQPYTVGFQSQLLVVEKGMKVLEIGTGSGYQGSVLAEMGVKIFSIERQRELYNASQKIFRSLGYKVKGFYGDGYEGLPAFAPFDRIIITCGAPFIPEALKEQLVVGGRMVIPVGEGDSQKMTLIVKLSAAEFEVSEYGNFSFVPMLTKLAR